MTSWSPNLEGISGPRYVAIAEKLAGDIAAGVLKAGDRLPTHRELAWRLGVTVGTVTRAYAEAERRGLVGGQVGRGTFVREGPADIAPASGPGDGFIDLARNVPGTSAGEKAIAEVMRELGGGARLDAILNYTPNIGLPEHRIAGAEWIARSGFNVRAAQVAVTDGMQHAMAVACAAAARPGDVVLAEELTFYGIKSLATMLSLRLHGVAMDGHGIRPDALDAACRQLSPKALYALPTLQNPTTVTMPAERRAEIAAICRRHGVAIVEDDIYGFLDAAAPPPLSSYAPEISYFATSLSKSIAPGLRVGYVAAPEGALERVAAGLRATTYMPTPITAEIAARLVRSGAAARIAAAHRDETIARQQMLRRLLPGADVAAPLHSMHAWLRLPEPWRREEFVAASRDRGVGLAPAEAFAVGRAPLPHAVRIGLAAARDRAQLERALNVLASLLREPPTRADAQI